MNLAGAKVIDFTGTIDGAEHYPQYDETVAASLRRQAQNKTAVVVDKGFGFQGKEPHLVSDHLNFTGTNPLVGPNHPAGERFPVVNGIYLSDFSGTALSQMPRGILAGLKEGVAPSEAEEKIARQMGADFYSYNLVQTMLVAAHAGWKVVGIVVPDQGRLGESLIKEIQGGNGGDQ